MFAAPAKASSRFWLGNTETPLTSPIWAAVTPFTTPALAGMTIWRTQAGGVVPFSMQRRRHDAISTRTGSPGRKGLGPARTPSAKLEVEAVPSAGCGSLSLPEFLDSSSSALLSAGPSGLGLGSSPSGSCAARPSSAGARSL